MTSHDSVMITMDHCSQTNTTAELFKTAAQKCTPTVLPCISGEGDLPPNFSVSSLTDVLFLNFRPVSGLTSGSGLGGGAPSLCEGLVMGDGSDDELLEPPETSPFLVSFFSNCFMRFDILAEFALFAGMLGLVLVCGMGGLVASLFVRADPPLLPLLGCPAEVPFLLLLPTGFKLCFISFICVERSKEGEMKVIESCLLPLLLSSSLPSFPFFPLPNPHLTPTT